MSVKAWQETSRGLLSEMVEKPLMNYQNRLLAASETRRQPQRQSTSTSIQIFLGVQASRAH
jgi:hypothetical protein